LEAKVELEALSLLFPNPPLWASFLQHFDVLGSQWKTNHTLNIGMDAKERKNPYLKYELEDVIRLLQSFLRQLNFELEKPKAPGRIVRGGIEGVGEILLLKQRQ
jgi:hypothetical protein